MRYEYKLYLLAYSLQGLAVFFFQFGASETSTLPRDLGFGVRSLVGACDAEGEWRRERSTIMVLVGIGVAVIKGEWGREYGQ